MLTAPTVTYRILTLIITFIMAFNSTAGGLSGLLKAIPETIRINQQQPEERAQIMAQLLLLNQKETFEDNTNEIAKELVYAVFIQFATGCADPGALGNGLSKLPHEDIVRSETKTYGTPLSREFGQWCVDNLKDSILPDSIENFLTMYCEGINDLYVYFDETEYEGIYVFLGSYVTDNGEVRHVYTGAYYDASTGMIYGKDNNGILGVGFDFNTREYVLQNPVNVWMRSFGYNIAYDILGNQIFMDCDTVRLKFNCDGRDWMIQLWKGNYTSLSNGAEIGIYYLKDGNRFQYTCADFEDMLEMRFSLKNGEEVLFERGWEEHWWLSGYQLSPAIQKEYLTLDCSIRFETEAMRDAFVSAAAEHSDELTVTQDGLQVNIIWK